MPCSRRSMPSETETGNRRQWAAVTSSLPEVRRSDWKGVEGERVSSARARSYLTMHDVTTCFKSL
ncbi:uncharacterized protein SEPMUDRAFT_150032 [Sphaerulina musiva SO2202]|uniref:Uncharacterized protein n=1 Tax=Sphaerulina musiva (strain SO2202) TaxID=692275 RepID=N1QKN9_SPHMS|nr:uncharacterized protein SEPMUDRAFT_150032 [Sphaerulina musiva SO2202]EMF12350.1 hypothetical protein SEPMUDRAFT_150032 [Sphaerulina musiva SO2202]